MYFSSFTFIILFIVSLYRQDHRSQPCLLKAIAARGVKTEKEMHKKIVSTIDIEKIMNRFVFRMSNENICPAELLILVTKNP